QLTARSLSICQPRKHGRKLLLVGLICWVDCQQILHRAERACELLCRLVETALVIKSNSDVLDPVEILHSPLQIIWFETDEAPAEPRIFSILGFGFWVLASEAGNLAHVKDVLRMVEQTLGIGRSAAHSFGGTRHRLA